jgi:hypothetical protein
MNRLVILFGAGFGVWYYFRFVDPTLLSSRIQKRDASSPDFPGVGYNVQKKDLSKDIKIKRQQAQMAKSQERSYGSGRKPIRKHLVTDPRNYSTN